MARILVVDDAEDIVILLGMYLQGEGHEVTTATSAENISALVAEHKPEFIILDYQMPGVNGVQALGIIRASPLGKNIPIIFLSGMSGYRVKVAVASSATERFMHKPVHLPDLKALMDTMLGGAPGAVGA